MIVEDPPMRKKVIASVVSFACFLFVLPFIIWLLLAETEE
jgi:hypothetical protein